MPSPSADFPSRNSQEFSERPAEPIAPAGDPEEKLLDQVLQQTVSALDDPDRVAPECLEALRTVARRHRGQPLTAPDVATDLVDAAMKCGSAVCIQVGNDRQAMLSEIVETLLEDPPARARLEAVWALLAEMPT